MVDLLIQEEANNLKQGYQKSVRPLLVREYMLKLHAMLINRVVTVM